MRGREATKNADDAHDYILKNGHEITEKAIAPRGMSGRLNMIGDNETSNGDYLPFMMVRAGEELFKVQRENQLSVGQWALLKLAKVKLRSLNPSSTGAEDPEQTPGPQKVQACLENLTESSKQESFKQASNRTAPGTDSCILSDDEFKLTRAGSFLMKAFEKRDNLHETIVKPHAVGLVVQIKDKAFDAVEASVRVRKDLKIDVFFNGELADCILVPERGGRDSEKLKLLFTGRRTDRQVERPWVVVPHLQEPDGSIRDSAKSKSKTVTPQEQWDQVAMALLIQADKRGRDKSGHRPPTGRYLAAVSQLEVPMELNDLQKHGNRKMGVIDVVVTLGVGKKNAPETCFLTEPEKMFDKRYEEIRQQQEDRSISGITVLARDQPDCPDKENIEPPAKRARLLPDQPEKADVVTMSPQGVISGTATPGSSSHIQRNGQQAENSNALASQANTFTPLPQWNLASNTGIFPQPQSPSSMMNSPSNTPGPSTAMYQIPYAAFQSPLLPTHVNLAPGYSPVGANPFVSVPFLLSAVPPVVQLATPIHWGPYQAGLAPAQLIPRAPLNSSPMAPSPSSSYHTGQSPDKTVSRASLNESPSTGSPSKSRGHKRKADGPTPTSSPNSKKRTDWPPIWHTPSRSHDCVITYAEVGENATGAEKSAKFLATGDKAAVFRQIKSTKSGEFEEEEVQAGFRFLIL
jgi:hypothetical protein